MTSTTPVTQAQSTPYSSSNDYIWISKWIMGETPSLKQYLTTKTASLWLLVRLVDATLRAAGGNILLSNPFCGILVIVAMALDDTTLTYAAMIGVASSIVMALSMFQEWATISSGAKTLNGFILGRYIASVTSIEKNPWFIAHIVIGSSIRYV